MLCHEITYQGDYIHIDGFTKLTAGVHNKYHQILKQDIFFGKDVLNCLKLKFNICKLFDPL